MSSICILMLDKIDAKVKARRVSKYIIQITKDEKFQPKTISESSLKTMYKGF